MFVKPRQYGKSGVRSDQNRSWTCVARQGCAKEIIIAGPANRIRLGNPRPCRSLASQRCSCFNLPFTNLAVGAPGTRARFCTGGACPVRLRSMTGSVFSPQRRQRHPSATSEFHTSLNWMVIMNPLQRGQRMLLFLPADLDDRLQASILQTAHLEDPLVSRRQQ